MITLYTSICSVFFIIINITSALHLNSSCITPNNWNGTCIVLQQCRTLYRLLGRRREIPTEQRNFLRNSQCGRDGTNPLVCCPNTFTIDDLPNVVRYCEVSPDKIIAFEEAALDEFQWMALLHYRKPGSSLQGFFCGGSLIHEKYVLTAAQCIHGPNIVQKQLVVDVVRLGEHDLRSNPDCQMDNGVCADPVVDIPVAEIMVHEFYIPTSISQVNDIALIRLEREAPVSYYGYIKPICLPVKRRQQSKTYDEYDSLTVAGFGRNENETQSEYKKKAYVDGFNLNECAKIYSRINLTTTNKQLCARGSEGRNTCVADSGGSLTSIEDDFDDKRGEQLLVRYIIGVVSFVKYCGSAEAPDVYTRVDQYIEWILDHMRK